MLTALLLSLSLALPAQDQANPPPDPKRIEAAVAELSKAFGKDGTSEMRTAAIANNVEVLDAKVIEQIVKGLDDKDPAVESAAIDGLGHMNHPDALKALHALYKKDKAKLRDDERLFPLLLRSIARQGSPASVEILLDDPFAQRSHDAVRARILGLGNIRTKPAVEGLISLLGMSGPQKLDGYMGDFRMSLLRLTGEDKGPEPAAWQKWWNDAKDKLVVSPTLPDLAPEQKREWNRYWGIGGKNKEGKEGGEEGGKKERKKGGKGEKGEGGEGHKGGKDGKDGKGGDKDGGGNG
jgi:hypothetical protein